MKKFESVRELLAAAAVPNPAADAARQAAHDKWGNCLKPIGSLGVMETDLEDIAALIGTADIDLSRRAVIVFCADNGVINQGVATCGPEITTVLADAFARRASCVCAMARVANCDVVPVDMGILNYNPDGVSILNRRMGNGTNDLTRGPAMTREQAEAAILVGAELVRQQAEMGVKLLATGELGMGNTTTATSVTCALLGKSPEGITGRGAGMTDEGMRRKIGAIETGLKVNAPDASDPIDVISKVGGFDIASMCGMFLGAAAYRVPVLADGLISTVAALCAIRLCPEASAAILASHVSAEPAGQMVMQALNKRPMIVAGMRLGEGTGAVAAMPLLDMALAVYNGTTFDQAGMDPCSGEGLLMLTLVIGGSASGKSEYAEGLILKSPARPRYYLATMEVFDEECRARVARHRAMRAEKSFETIECPVNLSSVRLPQSGGVLLEDLGNLAANEQYSPHGAGERALDAILQGIDSLLSQCDDLVIVSNELFTGGSSYEGNTDVYLKLMADAHLALAAKADRVIEVVYGIPQFYKGEAT